jgi:hypothetical protein
MLGVALVRLAPQDVRSHVNSRSVYVCQTDYYVGRRIASAR